MQAFFQLRRGMVGLWTSKRNSQILMPTPKRISAEDRIPVRLSERDRELIIEHTLIGPDLEQLVRLTEVEGNALVARMTLGDLEELIGYVAAEANHHANQRIRRRLDTLFGRLTAVEDLYTTEDDVEVSAPHVPDVVRPSRFTEKQGQYLAFIHAYTKVHRRPPAESDMQEFFGVTPPTVHQMVLNLEDRGLIARTPGAPRSIILLVNHKDLPELM